MAKSTRITKKKKIEPVYYDSYNHADVAVHLLDKLLADCPQLAAQVNMDDFEPSEMAAEMAYIFDVGVFEELLNTEFGRGLLFGMYICEKTRAVEIEEAEAAERTNGEIE